MLAVPATAFAQGAGDDQYQDPFPDQQSQTQDEGGGLSEEPPVPGGGGDSGGSGQAEPSGQAGDDDAATAAPEAATTAQLPNTGSDPRLLVMIGLLFVLAGAGLRLRTIDPDAY